MAREQTSKAGRPVLPWVLAHRRAEAARLPWPTAMVVRPGRDAANPHQRR